MLYQYDATKDKCPLPLVKLRLMLKNLQSGDVCLIQVLDKGSKKDIPNLLTAQGFKFRERQLINNIVEFEIAKG